MRGLGHRTTERKADRSGVPDFQDVLRFMEDQLREDNHALTQQDICEALSCSREDLSRSFQKANTTFFNVHDELYEQIVQFGQDQKPRSDDPRGRAPYSLLNSDNIGDVKSALLSAGRSNISEVARQFGYDGRQGFSHAFKRVTGISPSSFIKRHSAESVVAEVHECDNP
tara:strand:- start:323 stop:832 length:510 start_codon:yes stop_codon:yes gene_type:complete